MCLLPDNFIFNNAVVVRYNPADIFPGDQQMKHNLKAALLSAFVLPGLGQLKKGQKIKGGIILLLVNLFILVSLAVVASAFAKVYAASLGKSREIGISIITEVGKGAPGAKWLLGFFICLWVFSVTDALVSRAPAATECD